MKYTQIYYDGCNGFKNGGTVEAEPDSEGRIVLKDEDGGDVSFGSRNDDGLLENEEGDRLLVPVPEQDGLLLTQYRIHDSDSADAKLLPQAEVRSELKSWLEHSIRSELTDQILTALPDRFETVELLEYNEESCSTTFAWGLKNPGRDLDDLRDSNDLVLLVDGKEVFRGCES